MIKAILSEIREVISRLEGAGYFEPSTKSNSNNEIYSLIEKPPEKSKQNNCPPLVAVGLKQRRTGYETKLGEKGKKLTKKDALDIFNEDRFSNSELAEIYNVSTTTISHIKGGYTWWKATGMPKTNRKTKGAR